MRILVVTTLGGLVAAGCGDNVEPCDPAGGTICTIAGTGDNGYDGDGGPARAARLSLPIDTLASPDGSLFIIDWNNHRIRRLGTDGNIYFVAGNGELGGSLDDPATGDLNHPSNLMFDATGSRLYISAWHNSKILTLDPATGEIVDTCGDGRRAYFGDGMPALAASLDLPASLALAPNGNIVVLDQANQVIRQIDSTGTIDLLAGRCVIDQPAPGGPGPCADGVAPVKCPEPSGKYTCGDLDSCSKPCWPGYNGDDLPVSELRMAQVFGQSADPGGRMVYDPQGNLYFADVSNHIVRKIGTDGIVRRVAGTAPVGGLPQFGFAGDGGPATDAKLDHPIDLALANDGTLYISDVYNHCIRAVSPAGMIDTVVGTCGAKGYEGDGGPARDAQLNRPYGIEWAAPNTLYIADTGNSVIRVVELP